MPDSPLATPRGAGSTPADSTVTVGTAAPAAPAPSSAAPPAPPAPPAPAAPPGPPVIPDVPRRGLILTLLALVVLIVVMDLTILNVALEPIQRHFDASNGDLQWTLAAYMITFAAFIFPAGVSADRIGSKQTLMAGLLIFGVASALAAYSGSIEQLILWRAVMGIGAATVPTVTLAIIMNVFPLTERPRAIAVWAAAAGASFAVGPVVSGALLSGLWWGSVFLVNAPLIVLALIAIHLLVPTIRPSRRIKLDPAGVVLSILSVGSIVYGIVVAGEDNSWVQAKTLVPLIVGVVLVGVLLVVEKRVAFPTLDVSLFAKARFSAGTGAIAMGFFSLMGGIYVSTFYLQSVKDYSPLRAGLLMLPMGIGSVFMSARTTKLIPRLGGRVVVALGAALMAVAFFAYVGIDRSTSVGWLIVVQLVLGLGWGCIMAPATAALMSVVPLPKAGTGQAVSQTVRQIGAALGVAVIGTILSVAYRSSMGRATEVLPEALRPGADSSIGSTAAAVARARAGGVDATGLLDQASSSYVDAMHISMIVIGVVAALVVPVSLRWLPGRVPGGGAGAPAGAPAPSVAAAK